MGYLSCMFFKSYYYFIVYWILALLINIERQWYESNFNYSSSSDNSNNNDTSTNNNQIEIDFIYLIYLNIVDLSAGFLVAYTFFKMKSLKENKIEKVKNSKNQIKLIYNDPSKRKNKYKLILLISFLDFTARFHRIFFFIIFEIYSLNILVTIWLISFDLISRIVFCRIILKTKLYKHHLVSLIFCFIGFSILFVFGIINIENNEINLWIYLFFIFISKVLFALEDTINKILLTDKFLLPHYLMFWRGLFSFVIILLFTIIILTCTSKINLEYYKYVLENEDLWKEIISKIFYIICNFLKVFSIFKIIYIFTPQHVAFLNVIENLIELIQNIINVDGVSKNIVHFIFDMISLVLISIGTLIFNEMIILNFFGLNKNTKSGKIEKEALDKGDLKSTIIFNETDNEDKEVQLNDIEQEENEEKEMIILINMILILKFLIYKLIF